MLSEPLNYVLLASNFGYLWIPLLAFGTRIRDDFTRRALLVLIPYFLVGLRIDVFDELRIFGEMIPLVLLGLVGLARALPDAR